MEMELGWSGVEMELGVELTWSGDGVGLGWVGLEMELGVELELDNRRSSMILVFSYNSLVTLSRI